VALRQSGKYASDGFFVVEVSLKCLCPLKLPEVRNSSVKRVNDNAVAINKASLLDELKRRAI
jgi:hypothetical protein